MAVGVLDELDTLGTLGIAPVVAKKSLLHLVLGWPLNNEHRVGLVAGHHEVVELVTFDGVNEGDIAFVDFLALRCFAQGFEASLCVEPLDVGAVVEGFGVVVEIVGLAPRAVGVALEQCFVVCSGNANVGSVAVDQVFVLIDGLIFVAGKPFGNALAVVLGAVRRGLLAAQKEGDGVGAGFAEGAAAEFGNGDDVEILEQNFAGLDVGAVAVGQDAGGQNDGGDAAGLEQLFGAFDEEGFDTVVGVQLVDGVGRA